MTTLFDHAIDAVRSLPAEMQDDLARLLLQLAGEEQPTVRLTEEEAASFDESLGQASRRGFATDGEVSAVWAKHGL